jgi:hypothetical protein
VSTSMTIEQIVRRALLGFKRMSPREKAEVRAHLESKPCSCGLVEYVKQPEGHFAATHFDGQPFTYALFTQHQDLHQKMRLKIQEEKIHRRGKLLSGILWLACLATGPWLVFEAGYYHGQVKEYREEHAQELYYREQEAKREEAAGMGYYLLLPGELRELQSSEEIYGLCSLLWPFVAAGAWRFRKM